MAAILMCLVLVALQASFVVCSENIKVEIKVTEPANGTVIVSEGGNVKLGCDVPGNHSDVTYKFYKGTQEVASKQTYELHTFTNATDDGFYTCVAKVSGREYESYQLNLTVGTPGGTKGAIDPVAFYAGPKPSISVSTPECGDNITDNSKLVITCSSITKDVTYTFYKVTSSEQQMTKGVNETAGTYTIDSFSSASNAGKYKCKAAVTHLTVRDSGVLDIKVGNPGDCNSADHVTTSLLSLCLVTLMSRLLH